MSEQCLFSENDDSKTGKGPVQSIFLLTLSEFFDLVWFHTVCNLCIIKAKMYLGTDKYVLVFMHKTVFHKKKKLMKINLACVCTECRGVDSSRHDSDSSRGSNGLAPVTCVLTCPQERECMDPLKIRFGDLTSLFTWCPPQAPDIKKDVIKKCAGNQSSLAWFFSCFESIQRQPITCHELDEKVRLAVQANNR